MGNSEKASLTSHVHFLSMWIESLLSTRFQKQKVAKNECVYVSVDKSGENVHFQ